MIRMAPEGWPFVIPGLILTLLAVAGAAVSPASMPGLQAVLWGVAAVMGVLTAFVVFFFRNPVRKLPTGEGLVLAPADGRIVEIAEVDDPGLSLSPATRISIFLSIFDVHVQRAPMTCRVALRSYRAGGFAMAWKPEASQDNEQATLEMEAGSRRIAVRQIAGWVARRIVTDPEEGDLVTQGSRIGLIRFGSRVDLFIPTDWALECHVGDRARGGLTVLARVAEASEKGRK